MKTRIITLLLAIVCAMLFAALAHVAHKALEPATVAIARPDPIEVAVSRLPQPVLPQSAPEILTEPTPRAHPGAWLAETHGNSLPATVVSEPAVELAPLSSAVAATMHPPAPRRGKGKRSPANAAATAESAAHQLPEDARAVREAEIAMEIDRRRVARLDRWQREDEGRWIAEALGR